MGKLAGSDSLPRLMTVRTATFDGVRYDIHTTGPIDGLCDQPVGGKPSIHLIVPLDTQRGLETAIHESLHASRWHAREDTVTRTARDVARFLWRLGYRLAEP